jgi:hypothetical protein
MNPLYVEALTMGSLHFALVLAGRFGGTTERVAALLIGGGTLVTFLAQVTSWVQPELAFLVIDLVIASGFVALLVRSKLPWVGVACCAQSLVLAFEATRFVGFPLSRTSYVTMLQLSSIIVIGALIYGTWARRWGPREELVQA